MKTPIDESAILEELYMELRKEIDFLAKPGSVDVAQPTSYPDPVALSQIERRVLVRSVFAFIEALVYGIKMLALQSSSAKALTRGELALAQEEEYQLSESGEVVTRPARLRFLSNLRFAFSILTRITKADFQLEVSGFGWQLIRRSLKVRDRITHPKSIKDLEITEVEIRDALRAFIWFENQVVLALARSVRGVMAKEERLKNQVAEVKGIAGDTASDAIGTERG